MNRKIAQIAWLALIVSLLALPAFASTIPALDETQQRVRSQLVRLPYFGVFDNLKFQLHPVGPEVLAGMVLHELSNGKEALQFYRDYTNKAPDEMSTWAALLTLPDGHPMVAIIACYIGELDAAHEVAAPLKEFGPPVRPGVGSPGTFR